MFQLFISLFERLGIFAIAFILIMRFNAFKKLISGKSSRYEIFFLSVIFGILGITATYMGVTIQNAIANSRLVWVILGGILGGPVVALAAGTIAGGHRFLIDMNGFTALPCGIGTVVGGVIGSMFYHRMKKRTFDPLASLFSMVIVEIIQMLLILLLARPFDAAVNLVKVIGLPMIFVNTLGLAVFIGLVASVSREQERAGAYHAQVALKIASETLPFLRSGLDFDSSSKIAQVILKMTDFDAVAITDNSKILVNRGAGECYHPPGTICLSSPTKSVLSSGKIAVAMSKSELGCIYEKCKFNSGIIVPLKKEDKTIGTMRLYRLKENNISHLDIELANGLAHLFSNQLELAEVENQRKLAKDAEIRALQSQIKPHFLFNAINAIISHIRTSPEFAAHLLVNLAEFLRKNINPENENILLSNEVEHCEAYLIIEMARFEDRIKFNCDVDCEAMNCKLPPLIIQPLVENAIKHGIIPKDEGGEITLEAYKENGILRIRVRDTGVGMSPEQLESMFSVNSKDVAGSGNSGIALKNINARLNALYGSEHTLSIHSELYKGTTVSFTIPQ